MKLLNKLTICVSLLLSSICQLSAMQSKQAYYKSQVYDKLMVQQYGKIWEKPAIQKATECIECNLAYKEFNNISSKFYNSVLSFITNNNIKECSETELSKKATTRFLKDFIKNKIVAPKQSVEENINNLINDISEKNEDVIFDIIIEDYTDKYIKNNPIDLQQIFDSNDHPVGVILDVVQKYHENIYEKFRLALVSLADYEYFEQKYANNKKKYCEIISCYMVKKLTKALGDYFVAFVENNGWDAILAKYKNGKNYINKCLVPEIFDNDIINNNISIYTIPYISLSKKYNSTILQKRWNDHIDGQMISIFNNCIEGNDSINDMIDQFLDPEMKGYALCKYTTFLENRIKMDMEDNNSLNTILSKYKNENTKNFIRVIFSDLTKNKQQNFNKHSK